MAIKRKPEQIKEDLEEVLEAKRAFENEMSRSFGNFWEGLEKQKEIQKEINKLKSEYNRFSLREAEISKDLASTDKEIVALAEKKLSLLAIEKAQTEDMIVRSEALLKSLDKRKTAEQLIKNKVDETKKSLKEMSLVWAKDIWAMVNEVDGAMKKLNLTHGITNDYSKTYGVSLANIAAKTAQIGVSGTDLVSIQNEYISQTGRLSQLNEKNFEDISLIAKGTNLGVEAAAKMVGQFDLLGYGITESKEIIEETVNNVGKYGISSGKLLDKVNANLNKLNTMNFKNGVKGLIEMTKLSERFKIDMDGAFAAMDKSRTLEGSIDMAAKLMVMGGNFAKADPFKLTFLSRNDPAKFTAELVKMNRGIATFSKESGAFEIGAYDLDRLRIVAEATGQDLSKLSESVKETARFDLAKSKLFAGTEKQKDMIATMAKIGKSGKFSIDLGDKHFDDISKLTETDMKMLEQQNETLKQRALDSQTFDDLLKNVILEFKASFLPLLKFTNETLKLVSSMIDGLRTFFGGSLKNLAYTVGTLFIVSKAFSLLKLGSLLTGFTSLFGKIGSLFSGIGSLFGKSNDLTNVTPDLKDKGVKEFKASSAATAGNYAHAASIAAIGVAAVGMGYGIKLAADGFVNLTNSIANFSSEDKKTAIYGFAGAIIAFGGAVALAGLAAKAGWAGLAIVAGTALAIGGAIAIAAAGMAAYENAKNAGVIAEANAKTSFAKSISAINFEQMNSAFKEANAFISSDSSKIKKLKDDLETLSKSSFGDMINKLSNTMSKGVEMRLSKDAQLVIHNVLEVDGKKIIDKDNILKFSIVKQADINKNKTNVPM